MVPTMVFGKISSMSVIVSLEIETLESSVRNGRHLLSHSANPLPIPQRGTEAPLRRSALSASPCGDPRGNTPPIRNKPSMGPCKAPEGTKTKVTLAKGRFCAHPHPCFANGAQLRVQTCGQNMWQDPATHAHLT